MQKKIWQEKLGQSNIHLYGSFVTRSDQIDMDFAQDIRKALLDIGVDAIYCIQNVPHFAIIEQSKYDREEVLKKYAALWNQCLCTLLVVVTPEFARMFSLAKSVTAKGKSEFENLCLIRKIEIDQAESEFSEYAYSAESGRIWQDKKKDFNYRERIDHVLLENLKFACMELKNMGLKIDEAQAILIQTMFIAYLEDRRIITQEYFRSVSGNSVKNLVELLVSGNSNYFQNLFKQLKKDFNGDLLAAPCSFENIDEPIDISPESMKLIAEFRNGNMELPSGQFRLFGYDFRFIPIELISSVYDQFLTENIDAKRRTGAFYTPVPLVEITLSTLWEFITEENKEKGIFLDPACGSGIFLVRCFQRLCEQYRSDSKTQDIPWHELRKMVYRLHGRDLNRNAVRIAVFSLYVAMLDETTTKNIRKLVDNDCILPELWNKTLIEKDFFQEPVENLEVDVIFGNPPWGIHSDTDNSGLKWCEQNSLSAPYDQIAWPFVWKSIKHVKNNGLIALLLPSKDFLYNTVIPVNERNSLFLNVELKRIVDFSDFRKQLFEYSTHPTSLITFVPQKQPVSDYMFEFWMPKAERNPKTDRFSHINSIDKVELLVSFVLRDKSAFKQFAWMREPDRKLFAYLNRLEKLSDKVKNNVRKKIDENLRKPDTTSSALVKWTVGRGFEPPTKKSKNKQITEEFLQITESKYLDVKNFEPFSAILNSIKKIPWKMLRRTGTVAAYTGPRIIVSRGLMTSINRLSVGYFEEPFAFGYSFIGIKSPENQDDQAMLLAGLLCSKLATWYFFHCSGSFGVEIPSVSQAELLSFPFPTPINLEDEKRSKAAAKNIIDHVKKLTVKISLSDPSSNSQLDDYLAEIDRLTYEYFCLTKDEVTLIEDSVNVVIPSIHPTAMSKNQLWKASNFQVRSKYALQLKNSLDVWFDDRVRISVKTIGKNNDIAILKISLCDANEEIDYDEVDNLDFSENLTRIIADSKIEIEKQGLFDLKFFDGNDLFLIKPLQNRYWLESSAIADADEIIVELEKSMEQSNNGE